MVFRLCSQGVHIVPERSISRRRPSLCKASASKHMHSLLCSPTLGMACHGHCEAFLAGSSVPGLTLVLVRVMLCCVGQQDRNALWSEGIRPFFLFCSLAQPPCLSPLLLLCNASPVQKLHTTLVHAPCTSSRGCERHASPGWPEGLGPQDRVLSLEGISFPAQASSQRQSRSPVHGSMRATSHQVLNS